MIAITPLGNCNSGFRKNLEIGTPYKFYQNYDVQIDKESGRVSNVVPLPSELPVEFYSLKNGIELNISAVVGKNGSGKSTLIELLYYLVYQLMITKANLPNKIVPHSQSLILENKVLEDDYFNINKVIGPINGKHPKDLVVNYNELSDIGFKTPSAYILSLVTKHSLQSDISGSLTDVNSLLKILSDIGRKKEINDSFIEEELLNEKRISEDLSLSLIYEIKGAIYEIEYFTKKFQFYKIKEKKELYKTSIEEFNLPDFFYTISVNYSHHSLNSEIIGNWIAQLFHKNDAYITPVVINPMRDDGDIDINNEISLSTERVMSNIAFNLLADTDFKLLNKYKICKFIFEPKKYKFYPLEVGFKLEKNTTLNTLLIEELGIQVIPDDIPFWSIALAYLDDKLRRINKNYAFLIHSGKSTADPLINFIRTDDSHITKKVKQTLNFLKSTLKKENREYWKDTKEEFIIEMSLDRYLSWIKTFEIPFSKMTPSELSEISMPGFLSVNFELESEDGTIISPGKLSSGEQQMIFNVNSILYHLYNLQSVHKTLDEPDRIKYDHINIVLDEVELYYHPEMQRQMVENIKDSLENIRNKNESGIKSINVCFLTHSPFILSDIPSENILKLNGGKVVPNLPNQESFGANIYSLLANDFFMKDGFIGDFAMKKIKDVLDYVSTGKYEEQNHKKYLLTAKLVSDSVVRNKLLQLLNSLKQNDRDTNLAILKQKQREIDNEIKRLEEK